MCQQGGGTVEPILRHGAALHGATRNVGLGPRVLYLPGGRQGRYGIISIGGDPQRGLLADRRQIVIRQRLRRGGCECRRIGAARNGGPVALTNSGKIDEVWLFGFPYAGYYESIMAGPGAIWCNAPPLPAGPGPQATRRFVIMGFNYERGVGEMLEDLGHRAESTLGHVFADVRGDANLWERFTRYDQTSPERAECGTVHFAPNSVRDYDWGNSRAVPSRCDDWYHYPDFSGTVRPVNSAEWGGGDIRQHHLWWLRHFPHLAGSTAGRLNNWWHYIIDSN